MSMHRLKALLREKGVTQADLARLLGRDKSVITNLLQGRRQLKLEEAIRISRYLGVSLNEIAEGGDSAVLALSNGSRKAAPNDGRHVPFEHEPSPFVCRSNHICRHDGRFYLTGFSGFSDDAYALEVTDNGMNMAGVLTGDIVISEMSEVCRADDLVVLQHHQGRKSRIILRRYDPPFLVPDSSDIGFKPLKEGVDDIKLVSPVKRLIRLF